VISFGLTDEIYTVALIPCTCPGVSATYPHLAYRSRYGCSLIETQAVFTAPSNKYWRLHSVQRGKQWAVITVLPVALCKREVHLIDPPNSEGRHVSLWIQKYSSGRLNLLMYLPPSTMLALCFQTTTRRMNLRPRLAMDGLNSRRVPSGQRPILSEARLGVGSIARHATTRGV